MLIEVDWMGRCVLYWIEDGYAPPFDFARTRALSSVTVVLTWFISYVWNLYCMTCECSCGCGCWCECKCESECVDVSIYVWMDVECWAVANNAGVRCARVIADDVHMADYRRCKFNARAVCTERDFESLIFFVFMLQTLIL